MAALRTVAIRRSGNRPNLFMGGDRELVMFSGLLAFALIFSAFELQATIFGIGLWVFALFALRLMAKHDPQLRQRVVPPFTSTPKHRPNNTDD